MATTDEKRLTNTYGCAAIYLRRLLHEHIPETVEQDVQIIHMVEAHGYPAGTLDASRLSKWMTGSAKCDTKIIRALLKEKSKLNALEVSEHIEALDFMHTHAQALPDLINVPNVPPRVARFLQGVRTPAIPVERLPDQEVLPHSSAIVEDIEADNATIGDVVAEAGGHAAVATIRAGEMEVGNVHAGKGTTAAVGKIQVGNLKIGSVMSGVTSNPEEKKAPCTDKGP